jgi:MYXO-CTERM domain-containing protein
VNFHGLWQRLISDTSQVFMRPTRLLTFASLSGIAALSLTLLGGGCSSDVRPSEGPPGQTQAGVTLATPGFVETTAIQGLNQPTVVRFASDGRVFVAEKSGKIWVYDTLTDTTPTLFADLANRVHDFWDRGLLGLTLDPGFPAQPYVYVLYAYDGDPGGAPGKWGDLCPTPPGATGDGCVISGRLSRFTANGNVAGAETVLVEGWRQQYPSHSTGQVEFGPDGALYASGGDGASFNFVDYGQDGAPLNPLGDPPVAVGVAQTPPSAEGGALRSQSVRRTDGPTLLNGSVIRVNPTTGAALPDNPLFASSDENAQRIIAYGLRNPFRIAARPGKSELWIADVGWNNWEEVNRIPLGTAAPLNFGWPCYEGAGKQAGYDAADLAQCESLYGAGGQTAPYFTYAHNAGVSAADGCGRGSSSVTGIAFYTGNSYPAEYQGAMFFADYSRRCIYVMSAGAGGDPAPATARSFHVDADGPVFLTTGPGGDLFYAALTSGTIQRISYLQPVAAFTATPQQGQVPLIVNFDAASSLKAMPGDVLSYAWDLDGDGEFDDATDAEPAYLYDAVANYATRLKVTDQRGISNISQPLVIKATAEPPPVSTPPEVFIDSPAADFQWQVGDNIAFSGHASDAEDGALPASALSWQIVIQHCPNGCHIHDLLAYPGVASGSFAAEDHEYPMHLELILTATDSSGQKRSARRALEPKTVSLVFDTAPSGLELVVGSTAQTTPFTRRVIVGSQNSVSALDPQTYSGSSWKFSKWSDGLARSHALPVVTVAARYVATYVPGGGLTGQYFDELAFGGTSLTRIDPVIDFNWGAAAPDATLGADTFSVRWTGEINADFAETYLFSTTSDDGVRLSIDGAVVIDHFDNHAPTLDTGSVALTPGWHPIVLEYFENGGGAQIDLSWASPSQPEQIVPESHLRPGCAGGACTAGMTCSVDDLCVPQCDPSKCAPSQHCLASGGGCVKLCKGLACPKTDICNRGVCEDRCLRVSCASGQHCTLGNCVDDPPPSGTGGAGAGGAGGEAGATGGAGNGEAGATGEAGANSATGGAPSPNDGGAGGATPGAAGTPSPPNEAGAPSQGLAGEGAGGRPPVLAGGGAPDAGAATEPGGGTGEPGEQPSAGEPSASGASSGGEAGANGGGSSGNGGSSGGCSCKAAGGEPNSSGSFGGLALALGLAVARRRRR